MRERKGKSPNLRTNKIVEMEGRLYRVIDIDRYGLKLSPMTPSEIPEGRST